MSTPKYKPGTLIWCVECGDIKQVEVAEMQQGFDNETRIKYPNDDVMQPWYCWNGYLFKSRTRAVRMAIVQLYEKLADNSRIINEINAENKVIEANIKKLQQEAT